MNYSSRWQITFPANQELRDMPLEDVKGINVMVAGSVFEVVGVDDTWNVETGLTREITAREKKVDDLKYTPEIEEKNVTPRN